MQTDHNVHHSVSSFLFFVLFIQNGNMVLQKVYLLWVFGYVHAAYSYKKI